MPGFPAWRPDAPSIATGFARDVEGVLPIAGAWGPWPSLEAIGQALGAACRGAYIARGAGGAARIFAGTATKLYEWAGAGSAWTEVTRGISTSVDNYALGTDDTWSFDQFGNELIAVNGVDEPQQFTLASDTEFADLGGSPPAGAKFVRVVGDHVWMANFTAALGPSGIVPNGGSQIVWSGFRDPDFFTLGQKSCSFATFPSGGAVQGMTTQLAGIVLLERQVWRYVKDPIKIFDFAPILEGQGTSAPHSLIQHEDTALYYGTDGFTKVNAGGVAQIGTEWLDNWALENFNQTRLKQIIGALDPVRMRAFWIYPNASNTASYLHNGIVCYDMMNPERPWSKAAIEAEYIFGGGTPGVTLADLDTLYTDLAGWEAAGLTVGSDSFLGGAPRLAAFDGDHKLSFFTGVGVGATMQTAEFMPIPGKRFYVNGFRLTGDAQTATGRVGVRERSQDSITWKASASLTAQGFIPTRASGRLMTCEVSVPAGSEWDFHSEVYFSDEDGDLRPDGTR